MSTGTPRFFHSEDEKDFLAWLGLYVTTWSAIEHSLFSCLKTLSLVTKKKFELKPISLTKKLKIFLDSFDHPLLTDEREEAQAIADFLKIESDFRHSIIHGINARFLLPKGEWFSQQWMPEKVKKPESDNVTVIDQKTLENHYHSLGHVGFALMGLSRRTIDKLENLISKAEQEQRNPYQP